MNAPIWWDGRFSVIIFTIVIFVGLWLANSEPSISICSVDSFNYNDCFSPRSGTSTGMP